VPKIFDNLTDQSRLGPELRTALDAFDSIDVATGYLDLRGWSDLADIVDAKSAGGLPVDNDDQERPVARVLIGMVLPSSAAQMLDTLQQTVHPPAYGADINDQAKAFAARDALVRHLRDQLMHGLPTKADEQALRQLRDQLALGSVQMKVFTDAPLHGKTYILHAPGNALATRRGYLGSSNLTGAGLYRNLELNVDVREEDASGQLATWFEDRWNARWSLEITAELIDLIDLSWAAEEQPTPYEVYLRVCHMLSADAREGMGYVLPPGMADLLLDHQETAVRTLARRIVRRGGTMLGDVVGLGKTLTAVATALMLDAAEDYTTLILCPKNLQQMWEDHVEQFGLIGAKVVPYSMVHKVLPSLRRYHLVICDESHNLRNRHRAYEAVYDYIRLNSSKVLLLTATPYNLSFDDVANQLALYLNEDDDLGIQPSAALDADPTLVNKLDGKVTTLAAFRRSEFAEDWRRLMSDHLVRRTRTFLKRSAKTEAVIGPDGKPVQREYLTFANGEKFFFPRRVPVPLTHSFEADDPARLMEDDTTLNAVAGLGLPRYGLADYDDPKTEHTAADVQYLDDIRSGRGNVSGFVRVGLFKRLSSSGHSFILSLERHRARNELFCYAIEAGLPLPLGSFTDPHTTRADGADDLADELAGGTEAGPDEGGEEKVLSPDADPDLTAGLRTDPKAHYDELARTLSATTKWVNSTVFKPTLRKDLERDNATITALLDRFGAWDRARDSKLKALVKLLQRTHAGEKVLVFTEYSETAAYIAKGLRAAGVPRVGLATGDTDAAALARRFSPESNQIPGHEQHLEEGEEPLEVLVATDVLSEGQNLQDSHIVVNFDLPWAIIRLVQRAGRVDRVGQKADEVYLYLLTHTKVDAAIRLRQRIEQRLSAAAEAFGSDERFFGGATEVKVLDDLYKGHMPEELDALDGADAEGEADAVSEAWLVWSHVSEHDPDLATKVTRMQNMVHSTRHRYPEGRDRTGIVTYACTDRSGVDAFAASFDTPAGPVERLLTPMEALKVFYAQPTTPAVEVPEDLYERQSRLVRDKLASEMIAVGNLRGPRKWVWDKLVGTIFATGAEEALSALHERQLTEHARNRLSTARRQRYREQDLADLINELHAEGRLVIGPTETDAIAVVCTIGVTAP
jgi:hypothetical protein